MSFVDLSSQIEHVVVYARGAVVTRRIALPSEPLPDGPLTLRLSALSPLTEPGSVQVAAEGERAVLGVRTERVTQSGETDRGELQNAVTALERQLALLAQTEQHLRARRSVLLGTAVTATARSYRSKPEQRVAEAMAASDLIDGLVAGLDAQLLELVGETKTVERRLDAARTELAQASQALDQVGNQSPHTVLAIQLAPEAGTLTSMVVRYSVPAARWWPAYSARLSEQGRRAQFVLEAFVAQSSMEDWSNVKLALCTGDLIRDVKLPEMGSLRLGRAQPLRPKGYRPPPPGLEMLFVHYDRAMAAQVEIMSVTTDGEHRLDDATAMTMEVGFKQLEAEALYTEDAPLSDAIDGFAAASLEVPMMEAVALPTPVAAPAKSAGLFGFGGGGGWSSPPPTSAPLPQGAMPSMKRRSLAREATAVGSALGGAVAESPQAVHGPSEGWMDFNHLVLGDVHDRAHRGRLVRETRLSFEVLITEHAQAIEGLEPPRRTHDPLTSRGQFDHRFDTEGLVEVPSNGLPHRIPITQAESEAEPRLRTVPSVVAKVYREVALVNPFDAPLLAGPVDVFVDDALTTTSSIEAVDRGGTLTFGLGEEERIQVARNVRMQEASRGLLGGTASLSHTVSIELSSALGVAMPVTVVDRLPTTDDKEITVTLDRAEPAVADYDQSERGTPVDGGLMWHVSLEPGGMTTVEFQYTIQLSSRYELVGGNRRD
ncbi:MAG: DUF4139 domain-containing protein [Myxococcota bacterium]